MSLRIVNGTSHVINIYAETDTTSIDGGRKLILKAGAKPLMVIPAGKNLNATKSNGEVPSALRKSDLPLVGAVKFTAHDDIPDGDIVIVSNLFRSAVAELGGKPHA